MKSKIAVLAGLLILVAGTSVNASVDVGIVFSQDEIRIISSWYHDHGYAKKKGNGRKSKGLPPGIAKNLQSGKPLPPGIAKQYLPEGLQRALPAAPSGYERIIVDGKVLLVEIATLVVHDILTDVILD